MSPDNYTEEQQKDIQERVEKAKIALKELQLQPACLVYATNTGNDTFGFKPAPFLQDTKYSSVVSPIQSV